MQNALQNYWFSHGIIYQTVCAHNTQQNDIAERKNCHLLDIIRTLMIHMHVPKYFWADAVLTACHLINRVLSSVLDDKTPFFNSEKQSFNLPPKVFGECMCFAQILEKRHDKLDPRAVRCFRIFSNIKKKILISK